MNEKDDIILEYLRDISPSAEPVAVIHWNLGEQNARHWDHKNTTRNRLEKLESAGLVESIEGTHGYRRITDQGKQWLDGEIDAKDLDHPDD